MNKKWEKLEFVDIHINKHVIMNGYHTRNIDYMFQKKNVVQTINSLWKKILIAHCPVRLPSKVQYTISELQRD